MQPEMDRRPGESRPRRGRGRVQVRWASSFRKPGKGRMAGGCCVGPLPPSQLHDGSVLTLTGSPPRRLCHFNLADGAGARQWLFPVAGHGSSQTQDRPHPPAPCFAGALLPAQPPLLRHRTACLILILSEKGQAAWQSASSARQPASREERAVCGHRPGEPLPTAPCCPLGTPAHWWGPSSQAPECVSCLSLLQAHQGSWLALPSGD